jgi:hypothetical protein
LSLSVSFRLCQQGELAEANVSRRELVERVEQKNAEIGEKNKTIEGYLAKAGRQELQLCPGIRVHASAS